MKLVLERKTCYSVERKYKEPEQFDSFNEAVQWMHEKIVEGSIEKRFTISVIDYWEDQYGTKHKVTKIADL